MRNPVERAFNVSGVNRTIRDHRAPVESTRNQDNLSLPDGRLRRRLGYKELHAPVKTQALCKSTGVSFTKRIVESDHNKGLIATTPLSYGVIRDQNEFRMSRSAPFTIEFCLRLGDKEELVKNPFARKADYPGGVGPGWNNYQLREPGVYVLDKTILSNKHKFNDGSIADTGVVTPGTTYDLGVAFLAPDQFDVFPLTAYAFGYTESKLFFTFSLKDNLNVYWTSTPQILEFGFPGGSYNVGDIYHVAVVYNQALGANGRFILYINGVSQDTYDLPNTNYQFVDSGSDVINGVTRIDPFIDIVLLNESSVRASYASACKIRLDMHGHQTFFQDYSNSTSGINPWCCSPPRGTAMWDLRIWNRARTATEVNNNKFKRLTDTTSLVGNWYLNDGGPVCKNSVSGFEKRYCTIHHGYPGYVEEEFFFTGLGIKLGEGQHLIKSIPKNASKFGSGFASQLFNVFSNIGGSAASLNHREQNSFTVMMQIMVPDAFQQELNVDSTAPAGLRDLALTETRRAMNTGFNLNYDSLLDGNKETTLVSRSFIGHPTDAVVPFATRQGTRAYDQTLWSIEGTQLKDDTVAATNEANRRRIPLARGLLTPNGQVAFELFKAQDPAAPGGQPMYARLVTNATALTPGLVYTLTFVQRVNYVFNAVTQKMDASGWRMEIWIQEVTTGVAAVLAASHIFAAASTVMTTPLLHEKDYDISIGASYVNDGWDHSINCPQPVSPIIGAGSKTSFIPGGGSKRENHGPWPVQQRFMSPYQDQPGNFVVSMFRLWSLALPDSLIKDFGNAKIEERNQTVDLLANLEIFEVTGNVIPNKSRYSADTFDMGYKSWGMPQGYRNVIYQTVPLSAFLKKELFEGSWAQEDCLGYLPISLAAYQCNSDYSRVNGLMPVTTPQGKRGVAAVYDDAPAFDDDLSGVFDPIFVSNHGLMCEFFKGQSWKSAVASGKTFFTSPNALPKVFDGKVLTTAGFKKWSGGTPICYETTVAPGGFTLPADAGWYGIVLVYFSESRGIFHVSPVATVRLHSTNALGVYMVPHHPDPRVTLLEVYRTLPQATEELALSAPLFKTSVSSGTSTSAAGIAGGNAFYESIVISEPIPTPLVLDRNVTQFPVASFCAELNGRLYLADLNNDTIFFTDAGNTERIDALFNNLIIPGSSSATTGLVADFNALFVFKPDAIWRIDDIGGGRHQLTKVASIGAVSPKSIVSFVDPDSGATQIFFWSKHGPYLFDTNSGPRYIGSPIEESFSPLSETPQYAWLDAASVTVGHDAQTRELICFYAPIRVDADGESTELDRNGEAMVFNYRVKAWYRYKGTICTEALSADYSVSDNQIDPVTNTQISNEYRLLIGGHNGRIYSWGASLLDGVPSGLTPSQNYNITVFTAPNVFTIPSFPFSFDLSGCWINIRYATGAQIIAPIDSFDPVALTVTVNEDWLVTEPEYSASFFSPTESIASVCQPYSYVEFPWDSLDVVYYDKELVEIVSWHETSLYYRLRYNYDLAKKDSWKGIVDGNSKRKRTVINKKVEAVKLEIVTNELKFSVDGLVYLVHQTESGNTKQ